MWITFEEDYLAGVQEVEQKKNKTVLLMGQIKYASGLKFPEYSCILVRQLFFSTTMTGSTLKWPLAPLEILRGSISSSFYTRHHSGSNIQTQFCSLSQRSLNKQCQVQQLFSLLLSLLTDIQERTKYFQKSARVCLYVRHVQISRAVQQRYRFHCGIRGILTVPLKHKLATSSLRKRSLKHYCAYSSSFSW